MSKEIEARYLNVNVNKIKDLLEKNNFKCVVQNFLMKRKTFGFYNISEGERKWGRVRQEYDKITMAIKKVTGATIHDVQEWEIIVNDEELCNLQSQVGEVTAVSSETWHDNAAFDTLVIDIRGKNWQLSQEVELLNKAVLVSEPDSYNLVCIGASVRISRNGKELLFHIGGYGESDLDLNIISYNAPILAPLFRHEVGYVASAIIGKTDTELKILEIKPCQAVKFF